MGISLYHFPPSGPSRAALLVAKALGLEVDVHEFNLFKKEQLNEDFIKVGIPECLGVLKFLVDKPPTYSSHHHRWGLYIVGQSRYSHLPGDRLRERPALLPGGP